MDGLAKGSIQFYKIYSDEKNNTFYTTGVDYF